MRKKFLFGIPAVLTALTLWLVMGVAAPPLYAHHHLPIHTLDCSRNFPCPPEIQPRMRFWIEVFRSWGKNTAVLHDSDEPQRVYEVLQNRRGCRAPTTKLKRARKRVEKSLLSVAAKMRAGETITDDYNLHIAALFPQQDPQEIRAAAGNIRCQTGVRDSFLAGLARFYGYRPMITQVLAENNLPSEIAYLPFVESSYNPAAYSRAGAAGIWQIMPRTASVLGLKLNATLDERRDPEAATRAAAKYLRRADRVLSRAAEEFETPINRAQLNPFIITSYNYGINGMRNAIREVEPNYMKVLEEYKSPRFRIAVKNFYASFLAARHLAVNAERVFGIIPQSQSGAYNTVVLQQPASIERITSVFGLSEEELRPLNLALTRFVWRGWRMIPAGYRLRLPPKDDRWQSERAELAGLRTETTISGGDHYTVRRGDTACGIARAIAVSCSDLIAINQLGKRGFIRIGQKLIIPRKPGATKIAGADNAYRVRRGDTACEIAKRSGIDCGELIRHNKLGRSAKIRIGQSLSIPHPPAGAQSTGLNADNVYVARRGDSACGIAARFSVRCGALMRLNQLGSNAVIHPGQKLKIPGLKPPPAEKAPQQLAEVNVGGNSENAAVVNGVDVAVVAVNVDANGNVAIGGGNESGNINGNINGNGDSVTLDTVAANIDATTADAAADADVDDGESNGGGFIAAVVGKDYAAGGIDADDSAADFYTEFDFDFSLENNDGDAGTVTTAALLNILDTLPDLRVNVSDAGGVAEYTVRVEAEETLGHFADWLGMNGTGVLRELNELHGDRRMEMGRRLLLPIRDAEMARRFERQRSDYHQVLSESLKDHYDLVGVEAYIVRSGDSPWQLARRRGFPLWLFYRLNPATRGVGFAPGQSLTLPKLRQKI